MIIFNWIEISSVAINFKQVAKHWCYIKLLNVVVFLSFSEHSCLSGKQCYSVNKVKSTNVLSCGTLVCFSKQNTDTLYDIISQLSAFQFIHSSAAFDIFRNFRKSLENTMIISMTWPVKLSWQRTTSKTSVIHTDGLCFPSSIYVDKFEITVKERPQKP